MKPPIGSLLITVLFLTFGCRDAALEPSDAAQVSFSYESQKEASSYWNKEQLAIQAEPRQFLSQSDKKDIIKNLLPLHKNENLATRTPNTAKRFTYPVDVTKFPYSTAGKVRSLRPDGSISECTAQYIVPHDNVLITAAHCIRGRDGKFFKKPVFLQAASGGMPKIRVIDCLAVFNEWDGSQGWRILARDVAVLRTKQKNKNAMGLTTPPRKVLETIGYPENFREGQRMSGVLLQRGGIYRSKKIVVIEGHPFGKGASGGAWLSGSNLVGISGSNINGRMFSTLVRDEVVNLINWVAKSNCIGGRTVSSGV